MPAFAGVLAYAVFAQGAYYFRQTLAVAIGFGAVALVASARRAARPALPSLAGFGMLGGGLVASAAAAGWPSEMWRPILTLVTAGAALASTRALIRAGAAPRVLAALVWIATGIAVLGIVGVAFHAFPWAMRAQGLWRASSTLTYANATAALLTLALPAALLARVRRDGAVERLQVFTIALCLIVTLSRGGVVGGFALLVVLAVTGGRPLLAMLVRPGLAAICAAVATFPSIASWWARPVHATAGIVVGALIAGLPLALKPSVRRIVGVALAGAIVAAAFPFVAATEKPGQFIASRLGGNSDDRTIFWRASIDSAMERPVLGTGPGTYRGYVQDRGRELMVFYVHNEYLQAFAETGFVGLAAVLGAIAIFAAWAWRRRPPRGSPSRVVWAAAVAACAAFCVHGFFDFMWRMPAIVAVAFVWIAFALDARERGIEC